MDCSMDANTITNTNVNTNSVPVMETTDKYFCDTPQETTNNPSSPQLDISDSDTDDDDEAAADILKDLIATKQQLDNSEADKQKEIDNIVKQQTAEVKNNLGIFETWMQNSYTDPVLYTKFHSAFSDEYRTKLFDNICEFFRNEEFITDEILFYIKCVIVCLLNTNRRFKSRISELKFDTTNRTTNLRLVREKYTIRCFIEDEHLCWFKDNGDSYYVS